MAVQLFVSKFRIDECLAEIKECLEKGWTGLGYKTIEFEQAWCKYTEIPYAHFISSNTVGLHLALHMFKSKFKWSDNDEIITTPLTFVSTNHAILYTQLKPTFADIDQYLCLDPEDVERKITPRTRAIIFVGIGGNIGQYQRILDLCRAKGLQLILDAAHMAGTRYRGRHIGHDADVTVFSFQAVKNLPTADSGMICFKDADDDSRARKLTWLGINKDTYTRTTTQGSYKWKYDIDELGFKYHGNSIIAAIALVSLRYLDQDNSYRRQLAEWYSESLTQTQGIVLPPMAKKCESSRHLFQICVAHREKLIEALHEHHIYPGVHYRDNTEYPMYSSGLNTCPNAAKVSKEILSLPMHLGVTWQDVNSITQLIKDNIKTRQIQHESAL